MGRIVDEILAARGLVSSTKYAEKWGIKRSTIQSWLSYASLPYTLVGRHYGLDPNMDPWQAQREREAEKDKAR